MKKKDVIKIGYKKEDAADQRSALNCHFERSEKSTVTAERISRSLLFLLRSGVGIQS
jgi:hypothetical protein